VIVDSPHNFADELMPGLVTRVHQLIRGALSEEEILAELRRADKLRDEWRGKSAEHLELSHAQLWGELVADVWPEPAREAVLAHAADLSYRWTMRPSWRLVEGMAGLLEYTLGVGLPVAVVSNTRCGQAHRDALDRLGVASAVAAQIYSDEIGVRKPHPEMILAAAREIDVPVSACWMVGDQVAKDIVCARKAGVGGAILMATQPHPDADWTVADGHRLLALVAASSRFLCASRFERPESFSSLRRTKARTACGSVFAYSRNVHPIALRMKKSG
jgi:FMN phosphatase YigB (HAD superfamily)